MQGGRPKNKHKEKAFENLYKFLDEGESGVFTLDQVYGKLHQISDSEAFFSKRHLKQKLIEKYDNIYFTSEIGRKDVICFRSSLNEILREHLANKSEIPEDQAKTRKPRRDEEDFFLQITL